MNPFMMSNIFFGPMGMSISPMCCGGVNMPYYGTYDVCTFMNFPVFRSTASDYLLDPRLAMMQCQQQPMAGSIFGNNFLPLFNNFPGVGGFTNPWINPNTKPETEDEKKKREAKEAEAKKPEAQTAASLKKTFDSIKKLAETHKNFLNLDESIIKKADEAMKKETAEEQLKAMKEVMALIPEDIIRKTVLADEEVVKRLKEAGYNFNYKNNKYSLPNNSISENLNEVHDNIISKKDYTQLGQLAANLTSGSTPVLAAISTWNNTQKEKGILKFIANNIPTEAGPNKQLSMIVTQIVNALIDKADNDYNGMAGIKHDRDKLASLKDNLIKNFNAENLKKVSDAFETLYARLRMQEAVQVREYIKNHSDFKNINEVKSGIINDDLIVAETYANLKEEGINPPKEENLDKIQSITAVTVTENGAVDVYKEHENDPQGLINDYLAKDNRYLTKIGNTNVYESKAIDEKGTGARYFTVKNNKLIEVKKQADGTFKDGAEVKNPKEYIEDYDSTIIQIKSLIDDKAIGPYEEHFTSGATLPFPVFKGTAEDADDYYALIDGKFGKIKKCTGLKEDKTNHLISATGTGKTLDKLTAADLETDFNTNEIKTAKQAEAKKEAEAKKAEADRVAKISKDTFVFKNLASQLSQIGLESTGVTGYYKTKDEPTLYFRYDNDENSKTYQHLVHLKNVESVSENGTMKIKGSSQPKSCKEVQKPEESANDLYTILTKTAYKYDNYKNNKSEEEIKNDMAAVNRKMNSFFAYTKISDVISFLRTYQDKTEHWWKADDSSLCFAIVNNKALPEADKKRILKLTAKKVLQVVNKKGIALDDKPTLENIANGQNVPFSENQLAMSITTTALELDKIIKIFMEKYNEVLTSQAEN